VGRQAFLFPSSARRCYRQAHPAAYEVVGMSANDRGRTSRRRARTYGKEG